MPLLLMIVVLSGVISLQGSWFPSLLTGVVDVALVQIAVILIAVLALMSGLQPSKLFNREAEFTLDFGKIQKCESLLLLVWLVASLLTCFLSDWPQICVSWSPSSSFFRSLLFFGPLMGSLLAIWTLVAMQRQSSCRSVAAEVVDRLKLQALTLLIPLLAFMLICDVVAGLVDIHCEFQWLGGVVALGWVVVSLPWLMRWILSSRSISNTELGRHLMNLSFEKRTSVADVRIWDTGNRLLNGMVVGMFPLGRTVFLTDRLLQIMEVSEIESVFLHELGHVKRRHMIIRFLASFLTFCCVFVIARFFVPSDSLAVTVGGLMSVLAMGYCARSLEFDADRFACQAIAEGTPLDFGRATLSSYCSALEKIALDHPAAAKESWLHPSIAKRIQAIQSTTPVASRSIINVPAN